MNSQPGGGFGQLTPSTDVFALLQCASKGDINTLRQMQISKVNFDIADYDGRRAIHLAAAEGHLDCVKFLLEECYVAHSPRDRWLNTPLDEASRFKKEHIVRYLQNYISKIAEREKGEVIFGLLSSSASGDLTTITKFFQEGKDLKMADYDGRTALHLAAAEGRLEVVKYLLEVCKVPHSPKDRWYHTPLEEARSFRKDAVAKYLEEYISKAPIDPAQGSKIFTLLNAATKGDLSTLTRLNQEGFAMDIADYDGRTALHLAASEGHLDCVKFLLERCHVPINPRDRWNHAPGDEAKRFRHENVSRYLEKAQISMVSKQGK